MTGLTLLLLGCAEPPVLDPDLVADFGARHARVYDAFEHGTDADALHAHLAGIYTGEALTDAFVRHYRTAVRLEAEDVGVDVLGVERLDLDAVAVPGGAVVTTAWLVRSSVRHQAHTHVRVGRYRGGFEVVPTDDGPRIAASWLADVQRVRSGLQAGDLFGEPQGSAAERGFVDPLELLEAGALDEAP